MKELDDLKKFRDEYQQRTYEAEVSSKEAEIDNIMKEMSSKYPLAAKNEVTVLEGARMAYEKNGKLDKGTWETIYKAVQYAQEQGYKEYYKSQFNKQKQASNEGRDTADGGGIPGQAPKKLRMDEVAKQWEQDLRQKGF